jgi:hypothetical protein
LENTANGFPDRKRVFVHLILLYREDRIGCKEFYALLTQLLSPTHLPPVTYERYMSLLQGVGDNLELQGDWAKAYPSALNKHLSQITQLIHDEHKKRELFTTHRDHRVIADRATSEIAPLPITKERERGESGPSAKDFPAGIPSATNVGPPLRGSWFNSNPVVSIATKSQGQALAPRPVASPSLTSPTWGPTPSSSSSRPQQKRAEEFPSLPKSAAPRPAPHPESLALRERARQRGNWTTNSFENAEEYQVTSTHRRVKKQNDKKSKNVLMHFG